MDNNHNNINILNSNNNNNTTNNNNNNAGKDGIYSMTNPQSTENVDASANPSLESTDFNSNDAKESPVSSVTSIGDNGSASGNSSSTMSLKHTRKKWKEHEDIAFLKVLINNSQLLTYVEYFKPMKNFWIRLSHILNVQYGYERNPRQCHDRFKVLYFKASKAENTQTLLSYSNPDEMINSKNELEYRLFQLINTFSYHNGNIILKHQHQLANESEKNILNQDMTLQINPVSNPSSASSVNSIDNISKVQFLQNQGPNQAQQQGVSIPNQRQSQFIPQNEQIYRDSMNQMLIINELKEQVTVLRNEVNILNNRTVEQSKFIQTIWSMIQPQLNPGGGPGTITIAAQYPQYEPQDKFPPLRRYPGDQPH
ncbi:hypothetical protein NCAS_0B06470 [Naumovozyma castellii]|uniref:Myb-like domain-containing protein n=1 Tax=Naumovozyma castellii TaxID=27288 RepID=G0V9W4_NAUCA|nr:hypothetical protein NCAS_0B06470 [Naumovozyma castellii CBS 4309]CCC68731.1 hypothetical protein NCAS_0B06470 [Naumovozyma castellii CBS 4309]